MQVKNADSILAGLSGQVNKATYRFINLEEWCLSTTTFRNENNVNAQFSYLTNKTQLWLKFSSLFQATDNKLKEAPLQYWDKIFTIKTPIKLP